MASSVIARPALMASHSVVGLGAPLQVCTQRPRLAADFRWSRGLDRRCSSGARIVRPCAAFKSDGLPKRPSKHQKSVETRVATPVRPVTLPEQGEDVADGGSFDFGRPPPFTLADVRAAIPKHCFEKNVWRSMSYVARDVAVVFGLAAGAAYLNNWTVWPLYWFAQGTMFWALFVLGHDCGHGSFSNNKSLNNLVGHLTHSSILVPYHGWRVSHRTHHQHHGDVENDESWYPLPETRYKKSIWMNFGRLTLPYALVAFPFYLWGRSPGKQGSHFDPACDLFVPKEKNDVLTSSACYFTMVALLVALAVAFGPMWILKLYVVPYVLNVVWLDVVTYLHHHGHEEKVPWFRGTEWSYLRGGLSTLDRDYGIFNNIHHDIGTHVVHHLFPQIPHYKLIEATEAVKPVLGKYYREPTKAPGPFPTHLVPTLLKSFSEDRFVDDEGDLVYYQKDLQQ